MKCFKIIFLLMLFLMPTFVLADDLEDLQDSSWESMMKFNDNNSMKKSVTDKQFNETLDFVKNKGKRPKKSKEQSLMRDDVSQEFSVLKNLQEIQTIMIPTTVISSENILIEPGYYKLVYNGNSEGNYFELYQGHRLMAKIKAYKTNEDLKQDSLNFVNIIPYKTKHFKIIYGNIDLNLESILFNPEND